jgi:crossover junction endodeoxyribonuclease RuvC
MYMGLDLSLSATGAVLIDSEYAILKKEIITSTARGTERLYLMEMSLLDFIDDNKIDLLCIESPAYAAPGNLHELGKLAGMVELALYKKGINFIYAAPTQLKKYVTGKGIGEKSIIILDVYKYWGEEIRDNNIADAYVLSRIARDFHLTETDLKKYQLEVLKKIEPLEKHKLL